MIANMTPEHDPHKILSTGKVILHDYLFLITYQVKEYCVEFSVYEAQSENSSGDLLFQPEEENWTEYLTDPTGLTPFLQGYVKWDGCTNWEAGQDRMCHACTREQLTRIGTVLGMCHDLGQLCPNWYK